MLAESADSTAAPEVVWALLARPAAWSRWAPHLCGAWGLSGSDGVVRPGAHGAARLVGILPLPAVITAVEPGHSWAWRVGGLIDVDHRVSPARGGGSRITVTLAGPGSLEASVLAVYAPLVAALVRRLAGVAEQGR